MKYRDYHGKRFAYLELMPELREKAWDSFLEINRKGLYRRPGTIHSRINEHFIRNRRSSLNLLRRLRDETERIRIFNENLVEFTANGEYLNVYLEQ